MQRGIDLLDVDDLLADVDEALAYLSEAGIADSNTGVAGFCMGGTVTLAVAAIMGQGTGEQIGHWIPRCFGRAGSTS